MTEIVSLNNGLRIAVENIPYVRSVSIGFFILNGSVFENEKINGISHFIEHMFFKGTINRTAKELADEMDEIGGQMNAYTAKEYTCFYTKVLDKHFDIALDVLCDMFFNSKFDEEDIKKERIVINEEIKMVEDMPEDLVVENLHSGIWKDNPLGFTILGTEESISKLDKQTFDDYMKRHFVPENIVISVSGNIKVKGAVGKIEKYFNNWKNNNPVIEPEKSYYKKAFVKEYKDIEQLHIALGFKGIDFYTDSNYDMSVLNTVFGSSMSSVLFQKIREEYSLAYSVYSFNTSHRDTGVFNIYAGINPENYDKTLKVIFNEINILKKDCITGKILERTKEQIKSSFLLSLENPANIMSANGRSLLLLNRIKTPVETIKGIDKVTQNTLSDLIQKIFDYDNLSISLVGKINNIKEGEFNYE